jgi:hypothetical protein
LIGTQQVAWLHFTALSNQSSAFVMLRLDNTVGFQLDGEEVRDFGAQSGRLVIIGEEPLLEAVISANGQPALVRYGKPGAGYAIESTEVLAEPSAWTPVISDQSITNLFRIWEDLGSPGQTIYFRAKR